jgi:hypothetical protein
MAAFVLLTSEHEMRSPNSKFVQLTSTSADARYSPGAGAVVETTAVAAAPTSTDVAVLA